MNKLNETEIQTVNDSWAGIYGLLSHGDEVQQILTLIESAIGALYAGYPERSAEFTYEAIDVVYHDLMDQAEANRSWHEELQSLVGNVQRIAHNRMS